MTPPSELALVILPAGGWLLWTWGGLNFKPARRILWPLMAGAALLTYHLAWWRSVGMALSMSATLSPGYGPNSTAYRILRRMWLVEVMAGLSYAVSLLWIGINFWMIVVAVYVPLAFRLSRTWWPTWTHKYVEGFTGLFQGLAIAKRLAGV